MLYVLFYFALFAIKSLMLGTKCMFKLHEVGFLSALHSTHSARSNLDYIIVVGVI